MVGNQQIASYFLSSFCEEEVFINATGSKIVEIKQKASYLEVTLASLSLFLI